MTIFVQKKNLHYKTFFIIQGITLFFEACLLQREDLHSNTASLFDSQDDLQILLKKCQHYLTGKC